MDRDDRPDPGRPAFRLSDHAASLALPLMVIALGVALSLGPDRIGAFVDLCRAALH